jgi:hypothetical protein
MAESQLSRIRCCGAAGLLATCAIASHAASGAQLDPPQLEVGVAHDDNVTRAEDGPSRLGDDVVTLAVTRSADMRVAEHVRAVFSGLLSDETFARHHELSRLSAGVEAQLQWRPSAEFASPTFAVFAGAQGGRAQSAQRSGWLWSAGANVRQSWTDRIDAFAAITVSRRDARDDVFDQHERSLRVHFDYALGAAGTIYAGAELRHGDIVTTSSGFDEEYAHAARATTIDRAFGADWHAYRLGGRTTIVALGWSLPLGPRHAIDVGWRQANASARVPAFPGFDGETLHYRTNLYSAAWLARF